MSTNGTHVNCQLAAPLQIPGGDSAAPLPDHIQWMPPGRHTVWPDGFDAPFEVEINETIARQANEQLQEMRRRAAMGQTNWPYIDFNHEDREQSGEAVEFFWAGDHPKDGGVRVRLKWSSAGEQAVRGRTFRSFSPSWRMHKDTHAFLGIGLNVGGLVNRSAFQTIQAVAKGAPPATNQHNKNNSTMNDQDKQEISNLIAGALKPLSEQVTALAKLPDRISALEGKVNAKGAETETDKDPVIVALEGRIKSLETSNTESAQANARRTVEEIGVKAGRINSQDNDSIEFWTNAVATNAKAAEALAKMPVNPAFQQVVQAGANGHGNSGSATGEHEFVVKAREYGKAHDIKDAVDAEARFANTAEGRKLYDQYRESLVPQK